ncbi:MFS transporter [Rhizobium sp. NLR10a]|uniref:hypothetical protein n=1 Tax=Rhizobium TaxID=379 RepID=UPI001C82F451|nr:MULTISPECIES: hypothetical protein [Rhizobium]MBX5153963.1 MFS transporter [Rhizobium lentis]MBX5213998.1 MFS transporter [Rhizobium sp. NLR9a]MBX5218853.1 MFS transporter [Rhizobium sp. NLR8a]MBX5274975.1 MFS transporter [Rhizobium sp. NLR13a]MBX5281174.1 MFS transporter [Rhizobium sp. NLR10a]
MLTVEQTHELRRRPFRTYLEQSPAFAAPAITIVVASEFIVVGLLPLVSQDLRIPLAKEGELAGWWAFSAAVAGPFVTLLASWMAPRVGASPNEALLVAWNSNHGKADSDAILAEIGIAG